MHSASRKVFVAVLFLWISCFTPRCALQNKGQFTDSLPETVMDHDTFGGREKRSISNFRKVALEVIETIIKDARKVKFKEKVNTDRYYKQGALRTALKDFYSFNPQEVREPTGTYYLGKGKVFFGRTGQFRLRLFERGSTATGRPVLEVVDTNKKADPSRYIITYEKQKKKDSDFDYL